MTTHSRRTAAGRLALGVGAVAILLTGADHLDEYAANQFSTVPTIGPLFLANFVAATIVGLGLLASLANIGGRRADGVRSLLALAGIGIAGSSLLGLWISETWSLFGFTDYGFRPTIVTAIAAEVVAIASLGAYLALSGARLPHRLNHT